MSLIKVVKWFAIYVLLTLVFTAITALGAFIYVRASVISYEFDTMFFFFLLLMGAALVVIGVLVILRVHTLTFEADEWGSCYGIPRRTEDYLSRWRHLRNERKYGILLILVGLTLILVSITQLWL
jgi:hypothetical protein